jgi:hypothetical protein
VTDITFLDVLCGLTRSNHLAAPPMYVDDLRTDQVQTCDQSWGRQALGLDIPPMLLAPADECDRIEEGASEAGAISRCKSGPGKA